MGGLSLDDLMSGGEGGGQEGGLEPESRHRGRVVALRRDEVFVEFGGREQGCLPAHAFETPPQAGRRRSKSSSSGSTPKRAFMI